MRSLCTMKLQEIRSVAEREPFGPFSVRLSNGAQYHFRERRDFGVTRDFQTIVFFGESGENKLVLIDSENIVEMMQP